MLVSADARLGMVLWNPKSDDLEGEKGTEKEGRRAQDGQHSGGGIG